MNKIYLLIATFFLCIITTQAQIDTTQKGNKKFFIGLNFSPDLTGTDAARVRATDNQGNTIGIANKGFKISYTVGFDLCYVFTNFFSLDLDLQYVNRGYVIGGVDMQPAKISYHYLDIPLVGNFKLGKSKTKFLISLGLTTNVLLAETSTNINSMNVSWYSNKYSNVYKKESVNGFDRLNLSVTWGMGIQYDINPKTFFRIEPIYKCIVTNNYPYPNGGHLHSLGLNLSCYF